MGRPTDYREEYADQAKKLCALGATDEDLADFFEVSARTIYRWRINYEEFAEATKVGKNYIDDLVERRLFERAVGFVYTEQQAIKVKTGKESEEVQLVEVERRMPPDVTAMWHWLKNRRPEDWKDRSEVDLNARVRHELTSPDQAREIIRRYQRPLALPVPAEAEPQPDPAKLAH